MPSELKNLTLTELSLVDTPANPLAMAPIWKSINSNGEDMTDEVEKMSPEMDKKIKAYMKEKGCDRKTAEQALMKAFDDSEALQADLEKAQKENEKLRKAFLDEGYKITAEGVEKRQAEEFIEIEGEQIAKSSIPAAVLKQLEKAEADRIDAAIAKKAEETLPNFDKEAAKALMKMDLSDEVVAQLKAADELFKGLMKEEGESAKDGDMTDPNEKLDALAKKYAEEHKTTFAKAYAAVVKTDAGKALTKEIYKKD